MNYDEIVKKKYSNIGYDNISKSTVYYNTYGMVILFGMCPLCLVVCAPVLIYDSMKGSYLDYKRKLSNSILNYKNQEIMNAKVFMGRYSMNQSSYSLCSEKNRFTDYLEDKFTFPQIMDSYNKTFEKFLVDDKIIKPKEMTKLIEENISKDVSEKVLEFCKKYNIKDYKNYGWYRKTTFIDCFF